MTAALSDDEIEERFFIQSRMEILSLLNDLIHRREDVTVSFNGGRDFFQTTLLEARPEALIFDLGGDPRANERLPEASSCVFVGRPDGVRVQFAAGQAHRFSWGGSAAFWVPLPSKAVRMQRRESYRILMPVANPLAMSFVADGRPGRLEFPVHDLSVNGLGLTVKGDPRLDAGQEVVRGRFRLPGRDEIQCQGVVRHSTQLSEGRDLANFRLGIGFTGLARSLEVTIQRYIIEIEHERRELLGQ